MKRRPPEEDAVLTRFPDTFNTGGPHTPTWKRLTSYTFPPHEVISFVEEIFASEDEVKAIHEIQGDDAQIFVNVIHEV